VRTTNVAQSGDATVKNAGKPDDIQARCIPNLDKCTTFISLHQVHYTPGIKLHYFPADYFRCCILFASALSVSSREYLRINVLLYIPGQQRYKII
jgi:hypothetical protein